MEFIHGLLGFAVLTGPLWLILILLPASLWLAFKLSKRFKPGSTKAIGRIGLFLLLFLIPFGDEIAGRLYLGYLCSTQAGVKVYQTVELPAEYWDEEGRARFIDSQGILVREVLGDRFQWRSVSEPYISWPIKIYKKRWFLQDSQSKNDLGEKITFVRHYGWLNHFSPASTVGESCRNIWAKKYGQDALFRKEDSDERDFVLRLFIQ